MRACFFFADFSRFYGTNYYPGLLNHEYLFFLWAIPLSLAVVAKLASQKQAIHLPWGMAFFWIVLTALVGWIWLSSVWSWNASFGWKEARVWLFYLPVAFAVGICCASPGGMRKTIMTAAAIHVFAVSAFIIHEYYRHGCYVPYITLYLNRSLIGETLIVSLPLLMGFGLLRDTPWHRFLRIASLLGYTAVLIMAQRAPLYAMWVALLIFFPIVFLRYRNLRGKTAWGAMAILAITLFFLIPHRLNGGLKDWDTARRAYNIDQALDTFHYRINGILVSFYQWKDNWLLGTGQGTYALAYPEYAGQMVAAGFDQYAKQTDDKNISRAHCEPAQVAGELGLVGLILWGCVFGILPLIYFLRGWKIRRMMLLVGSLGLVAIGVSSLASSFGTRLVTTGAWFFIIMALVASADKRRLIQWSPRYVIVIAIVCVVLAGGVFFSLQKNWSQLKYYYQIQVAKKLPGATYSKELRKYAELIRQDPHFGVYYYAVANTMASHGNMRLDESPRFWRQAFDLGLFSSTILSSEAFSLYLGGKTDSALQRINQGLAIYPDSWWLHCVKAAMMENGQMASHESIWTEAQNLAPAAAPVIRRVFREMFTGQTQNLTRQELYLIPQDLYSTIGIYYFNAHPENRRLPVLIQQDERAPWE